MAAEGEDGVVPFACRWVFLGLEGVGVGELWWWWWWGGGWKCGCFCAGEFWDGGGCGGGGGFGGWVAGEEGEEAGREGLGELDVFLGGHGWGEERERGVE